MVRMIEYVTMGVSVFLQSTCYIRIWNGFYLLFIFLVFFVVVTLFLSKPKFLYHFIYLVNFQTYLRTGFQ